MAIPSITNMIQNYDINTTDEAIKNLANGDKEVYGVKFSSQTADIEQHSSIVSHFFDDKTAVNSDSMKLTYQAAIEKINELMSIETDAEFISQKKLEQSGIEYWSPTNTANRIIEEASFFLSAFKKANPELEGKDLMDKFNEVIGGGLKQGFTEAEKILGDLKVFDGEVKDNFAKTFSLVEQGMLDFRNTQLAAIKKPEDEAII
jgi:hypothetical protein